MDHAKLRNYLAQVAPEEGNVESYREHTGMLETALDTAPVPEPLRGQEAELVAGALRAVERDKALTNAQAQALEAIVLPKGRPVIDVTDGTFATPDPPVAHFGLAAVRQIIERTAPSVRGSAVESRFWAHSGVNVLVTGLEGAPKPVSA